MNNLIVKYLKEVENKTPDEIESDLGNLIKTRNLRFGIDHIKDIFMDLDYNTGEKASIEFLVKKGGKEHRILMGFPAYVTSKESQIVQEIVNRHFFDVDQMELKEELILDKYVEDMYSSKIVKEAEGEELISEYNTLYGTMSEGLR